MTMAATKEPSTDIATIIETNPVAVLIDTKTYDDFYAHIKAEVDAFEPDLTTVSGRKQIASMAYKVTRTKTAIDAAGKALNEDARKQINKVDEQRRKIRADLDALAEDVRKPLTEWEKAEEDRIAKVAKFFEAVRALRTVLHGAGSEMMKRDLDDLNAMSVDQLIFLDRADEAENALTEARQHLADAIATAEKTEENERELARLRSEQEARVKADLEAAEKRERERLAKEAADRAEAESKRREEEAAERARAEEKRLAEEAIAKAEREKQAAIQKAEAEKLALIREQERKEAERKAEEERAAAEQAKREANKRHRAKLTKEAVGSIRALGIDAETSELIVDAIINGKIPHIEMRF